MDTNKRRQTTERQTKKRKKHNVVTVTVDVGSEEESVRAHGSSSKAPTESIEVDQGDLQVADELIEIRKLILEGDHPELEVNSADDIEEHVMNKGNLLASCANNIDRRITELNLPWTGTTLQKCITKLDALEKLDLGSAENLTSIPEWIDCFKNLKRINLPYGWSVKELPEQIYNLANLEVFEFEPIYETYTDDIDEIYGKDAMPDIAISPSIAKLSKLKALRLNNVNFLPHEIKNLSSLEELDLGNYKVAFLPTAISKLVNLKRLGIRYAKLVKSLPESIGKLTSLEEIHMEGLISLSSLPESIGDLKNLKVLSIDKSDLERLPASFGNLPKLRKLALRRCEKLETLPDCLGDVKTLESLILTHSSIRSLPTSIGNLQKLSLIDVRANGIRKLPNEIVDLPKLRDLVLSDNPISALPANLKRLTTLRRLTLDGTLFEGKSRLSKILKDFPSVGCIGHLFFITPAQIHTLFSRRVKARIWDMDSSPPVSLWPLILTKRPKSFEYCSWAYWGTCGCCQPTEKPTPQEPDVVFQLLVEFGHKFVSSGSVASK